MQGIGFWVEFLLFLFSPFPQCPMTHHQSLTRMGDNLITPLMKAQPPTQSPKWETSSLYQPTKIIARGGKVISLPIKPTPYYYIPKMKKNNHLNMFIFHSPL